MQTIADHFGVSRMTVSRAVKDSKENSSAGANVTRET
jgi:DNA-binding LacI/PurR family transcriptional regulator